MRTHRFGVVAGCLLAVWMTSAVPAASRASARSSADEAAARELLEGKSGRRETWATAPALVVMASVLEYTGGDMTAGYVASGERLTDADVAELTADLTSALDQLTADTIKTFRSVRVETVKPGDVVKVLRAGQIVVGRFHGVQEQTGNLGYGGRMTRNDGSITSAAVILDASADQKPDRARLMRTHELGHALGFNHVESRPSVMNPRVGSAVTDFDRATIRQAFSDPALERR